LKKVIAVVLAASTLATLAGTANAQPHRHHMRMCSFHHHHRVCTWGWR
jgi:hypothetical protein